MLSVLPCERFSAFLRRMLFAFLVLARDEVHLSARDSLVVITDADCVRGGIDHARVVTTRGARSIPSTSAASWTSGVIDTEYDGPIKRSILSSLS